MVHFHTLDKYCLFLCCRWSGLLVFVVQVGKTPHLCCTCSCRWQKRLVFVVQVVTCFCGAGGKTPHFCCRWQRLHFFCGADCKDSLFLWCRLERLLIFVLHLHAGGNFRLLVFVLHCWKDSLFYVAGGTDSLLESLFVFVVQVIKTPWFCVATWLKDSLFLCCVL